MQVLILDDNRELRDFLIVNLHENGVDAIGTGHSIEALNLLKQQKFDVVIVDTHLEGEDGFDFIQKVRENRSGKSIPVIVLSNHNTALARRVAADYGCNAFLSKPFTTTHLLDQLRSMAV